MIQMEEQQTRHWHVDYLYHVQHKLSFTCAHLIHCDHFESSHVTAHLTQLYPSVCLPGSIWSNVTCIHFILTVWAEFESIHFSDPECRFTTAALPTPNHILFMLAYQYAKCQRIGRWMYTCTAGGIMCTPLTPPVWDSDGKLYLLGHKFMCLCMYTRNITRRHIKSEMVS